MIRQQMFLGGQRWMLAGVSLARMEGHIPSGLNGVVRWSQTWSIKALDPMLSLNSTYSSGPTTNRVVSEDMASAPIGPLVWWREIDGEYSRRGSWRRWQSRGSRYGQKALVCMCNGVKCLAR